MKKISQTILQMFRNIFPFLKDLMLNWETLFREFLPLEKYQLHSKKRKQFFWEIGLQTVCKLQFKYQFYGKDGWKKYIHRKFIFISNFFTEITHKNDREKAKFRPSTSFTTENSNNNKGNMDQTERTNGISSRRKMKISKWNKASGTMTTLIATRPVTKSQNELSQKKTWWHFYKFLETESS